MGYWIAALLLVAFGFITGFSIGPPFLLVGLAMLVLGPLRRRPRLYWPPLVGVLAFILGVVPLVTASGAGEYGRHSVGTTVFGGMIMSTILNLFFIPVLYLLIEGFRERRRKPATT